MYAATTLVYRFGTKIIIIFITYVIIFYRGHGPPNRRKVTGMIPHCYERRNILHGIPGDFEKRSSFFVFIISALLS